MGALQRGRLLRRELRQILLRQFPQELLDDDLIHIFLAELGLSLRRSHDAKAKLKVKGKALASSPLGERAGVRGRIE